MNILIVCLVILMVAYMMVKEYNPQATLLTAGIILLVAAHLLGLHPVLEKSTGLFVFDIWQKFADITNTRLAKVGLTLVSIAGLATYLNYIGASKALVDLTKRPVMAIKNPYLLTAIMLLVTSILYIFITGATSLTLLLMGTMYPLLRNAGLSAKTTTATIVIPTAWEVGPGQLNTTLAAEYSHIEVMKFVLEHQVIFMVALWVIIPFVHIAWQSYLDKKDGYDVKSSRGKYFEELKIEGKTVSVAAPKYYALLPLLPFGLLFFFSSIFGSPIHLSIAVAMMSTLSISIIVEIARYREVKTPFANFKAWLDGTGMIFAAVVTLMLAAEFFAAGLKNIGALEAVISLAEGANTGALGFIIIFSLFTLFIALITGSGNAPAMAFLPLIPQIAQHAHLNVLVIMLPVLFAVGIGRTMSPIAGVIIAASGLAKITTMELVKRTSVPMIASMLMVYVVAAFS